MNVVCILCRRSISMTPRTYKLAGMYNLKVAKEIVDEMNRSQLYINKWHYILTDERGEEIYPTTVKQRLEMLNDIERF